MGTGEVMPVKRERFEASANMFLSSSFIKILNPDYVFELIGFLKIKLLIFILIE